MIGPRLTDHMMPMKTKLAAACFVITWPRFAGTQRAGRGEPLVHSLALCGCPYRRDFLVRGGAIEADLQRMRPARMGVFGLD